MEYGKKITITYGWWIEENIKLTEDNKEILDDCTLHHIVEMQKETFIAGELAYSIEQDNKKIDVAGWWDWKTIDN